MKRLAIALAVVVGLVAMIYACALPGELPADRDGPSGLAGTYLVNGVDPNGGEYSGSVVITETETPGRFRIEWIVTGGIHTGTATRTGSRLDVEWETTIGVGSASGTARYEIAPDGTLTGERFADGVAEPGTETIHPDATAG